MKVIFILLNCLILSFSAAGQCSISSTDTNICAGNTTQFSYSASKTVSSVVWDFDNGQSSTSLNPVAPFQKSGVYNVSSIFTFSDGSKCTAYTIITVHNKPDASLEIDPSSVYCRDVNTICLNDLSTTGTNNAIVRRHFMWGDGNIDFDISSSSLCHHYTLTNKKVELGIEVFDSFGCSDTVFTEIRFDPIIYTKLSLNTISETCENGSYCVELENSPSSTVKSISWTKNAANIGSGSNDCFTSSGNFSNVYRVKVENSFGCFSSDSLSFQREFEKGAGPASIVDDTICFGQYLEFELSHPEQSNDSFRLLIVLGDLEIIDTVIYPVPLTNLAYFKFTPYRTGKHEFHVRSLNPVRNDCKLDTVVYAWVRGPLTSPNLTNYSQCVPRDTVFFKDSSLYFLNSTAISYYWDFGDAEADNQDYAPYNPYQFNQFSTMQNTKHFYQKIGCYGGSLTIVDSITGCASTSYFGVSTSNVGRYNLRVIDKQPLYCETDTIHFARTLVGHNYQEIDPSHMQGSLCSRAKILSDKTNYRYDGRDENSLPVYRFRTNSYCEPQDVSIVSSDSRNYYYANGSSTPTYISDSVCYTKTSYDDLITVDNNSTVYFQISKITPLGCDKIQLELDIQTIDSVQAIKLKWTDSDSLYYEFDDLTIWDTILSITLDTGTYDLKYTFYSKCSCETIGSIYFGGGLRMKPIINAVCGGSHFDIGYNATYIGGGHKFTGDTLLESYNWRFDTLGWTRNMDTVVPYDTFGGYYLHLAYSDSSGNCVDTISTLVSVKKVQADFSSSNDEIYCKKLIAFYDESIVRDSGTITHWSWNLSDSIISVERNPFKLFKLKGTYPIEIIATSREGCKDTIQKQIIIDGPNPLFALKTDSIGCIPLGIELANRSEKAKFFIWEWNDAVGSISDSRLGDDSIQVFEYSKPGRYCPVLWAYDTIFTRDDYHVCKEFYPDPDYNHPELCVEVVDSVYLNFMMDDIACTGQFLNLINLNESSHLDYFYYLEDSSLTVSWDQYPYYKVLEEGGYIDFVFYARSKPGSLIPNCSDTFSKRIEVQDPKIDMAYCLESGDEKWRTITVQTNAEYITKYLWTSETGTITNEDSRKTTIRFPLGQTNEIVCLDGETSKGCKNKICENIYLPTLEIFNVFTPGNDEKNNSFDFVTEYLESYNLEIYNRYGELVFKSTADGEGDSPYNWDGTDMDTHKPLPEGTYFYIFKYTVDQCEFEIHTIEGQVELIR